MTRPHDTWLRPLTSPRTPDLTVICLPHAGGASSYFRRWIPVTPERVELLGVQYPGREDRISEPVPGTVAALAGEVAAAVASELRERPRPQWALFGHSLGAAIAFEVTRLLENQDLQPDRLIVSARHAPHIRRASTLHLAMTSSSPICVGSVGPLRQSWTIPRSARCCSPRSGPITNSRRPTSQARLNRAPLRARHAFP